MLSCGNLPGCLETTPATIYKTLLALNSPAAIYQDAQGINLWQSTKVTLHELTLHAWRSEHPSMDGSGPGEKTKAVNIQPRMVLAG